MHIGERGVLTILMTLQSYFTALKPIQREAVSSYRTAKVINRAITKKDKTGKIKETTNTSNDQDKIKQKTKIKIEYKH